MSFNNIANLIRNRRQELNISQEELSKKIGYKNGQFISNAERGLCSVPGKKIKELATALKITQDSVVDAMSKDYRIRLYKKLGRIK